MSVENPEQSQNDDTIFVKPCAVNGEVNGVSNGHSVSTSEKHRSSSSSHKSSSKDKHRDKDRTSSSKSSTSSSRDKDKHRSSSSHHSSSSSNKDKEKDKEGKSSSSSSHKSSSRDKDREKEKERQKEKDKNRDKDKDIKDTKDKDKDKDIVDNKDKDSNDKDKDIKEKDKSRDKDKHRSSDGKDKERSKDHKSSSSSSHRDKDKTTSSSSHRDKDKDRSEKDKERSSHHKSSSSSNKDKHSSSSSSRSKDKHRSSHSSSSKDKDRHREKRDKEKETEKENKSIENNVGLDDLKKEDKDEVNTVIKRDEESRYDFNGSIKIENDSFDEVKPDIIPCIINASQTSSCDYSMSQFKTEESFEIKKEADNTISESQPEPEPDFDVDVDIDEDIPLSKRKQKIISDDDEDELPLIARKKIKKEEKKSKKKKHVSDDEEEDEEYEDVKPKKKKMKKEKQKEKSRLQPTKAAVKQEIKTETSPVKGGRKKKEEPVEEVWRWWEEEKKEDGVKWNFLEHKGPVFAPEYIPLPDDVKFYYDGKVMKLSQDAEEVACFYSKMLEHEYTSKKVFNDNFFKDWRKFMDNKEKEKITNLFKCNFQDMCDYFKSVSEKNKTRTKNEKEAIKVENEALLKEYGFCIIDGHQEKIGNFRIEPPGLFRGRGEHPKMGMVKRRVRPCDVLINCAKNSKIAKAPEGQKWKEVRHDNTVTWLASWTENVQGQVKYVMLNPSSKIKGEKDWQKYEIARRLHKTIDKIRNTYRDEWKSKEMRIRQRAVALYFIDKLALRAGNEKDEDQADTVGCCSLRVEHITLHKELDGKECVVVFDFLGKDSIRYYNEVEVEKRVFKNLELFKDGKKSGDDLFDRLNTSVMNDHLRELMDGLSAKVFRTYNASITLQNQLDELTDPNSSVPEKLLSYNRANRAVAILCNHQRSVPKSHDKSMENLKEKIRVKREQFDDAEIEIKDLQKAAKRGSMKDKINFDKKKKALDRFRDQLKKMELQETDRDENKTVALGTSKLNYLDPRISVAWCKKHDVPIEKIFNKTQRDKFRWAIEMADENYSFIL